MSTGYGNNAILPPSDILQILQKQSGKTVEPIFEQIKLLAFQFILHQSINSPTISYLLAPAKTSSPKDPDAKPH